MLDQLVLPPPVWVGLRIAVIALAAGAAFVLLRTVVRLGVRQLVERRDASGADVLPAVELERRVNTIGRLIVRILGGVIVVIASLMVLDLFGMNIGPAVAGLGVVGIAVGFGAQTLIKDWLAGIFIVLENQYSQGDIVRIAGVDGVVEDFSLRRTSLRDLDGTVHTVPNGQITVASNMTRLWARVNLDIGVAYDTDIDRATEIIDRVGEDLQTDSDWGSRMLEAPKVVRVDALADSAVTLKVLGQVRAAEQWAVGGELRKRILAAFTRAGIEIPFPHRVVVSRGGAGGSDSGAPAGTGAAPAEAPAEE
ncbi:MAG TPA: mechanosensitive ion channel family protein [Candidatus Limnocylindria bacterium]|nr:mechanosensitive ion channel family protein [Candidatus Limnocylindria bacterium]